MPQAGQYKKIGEIAYSSGNTVTFSLRDNCEGYVLEDLRVKMKCTTAVAAAGTAITLNPFSLQPTIQVIADRGGVWHQGEGFDYKLRDTFFKRAGNTVAEDAAEDTDEVSFIHQISMIPPGGRKQDFGLHLRESGDVNLAINMAAITALMAGGTITFSADPVWEIFAKTSKVNWMPTLQYVTNFKDVSGLGTAANTAFSTGLPVGGKGTSMAYTHLGVRAMNLVATSGRAHIAYATTAVDAIKLVENGEEGEFTHGPIDGDDLQNQINQDFRVPDGVIAGVYFQEWLASNGGDYSRCIKASGLTSLDFRCSHGAFATNGVLRLFYGYFKNMP